MFYLFKKHCKISKCLLISFTSIQASPTARVFNARGRAGAYKQNLWGAYRAGVGQARRACLGRAARGLAAAGRPTPARYAPYHKFYQLLPQNKKTGGRGRRGPPFFNYSSTLYAMHYPCIFSSQTINTAISAGETPEIRAACPMERGRIFESFCAPSRRSPLIDK